jgi:hypothetical protein
MGHSRKGSKAEAQLVGATPQQSNPEGLQALKMGAGGELTLHAHCLRNAYIKALLLVAQFGVCNGNFILP